MYEMFKRNKLILVIIFLLSAQVSFARSDEPATNIGTSLSAMKIKFPELRYIGTDEKGDKYEDGYPENGIGMFFYFKNNIVIEECMIVQSDDGFARQVFNSWVDAIYINYSGICASSSYNAKHILYSNFRIHIIFVAENGTNTALIVYEKDGWKDGIGCGDI